MSYIDTHLHIITDEFIAAVQAAGPDPAGTIVTKWSVDQVVSFMDERGIGKGILSFTSPGPLVGGHALVRQLNEQVRDIVHASNGRFGWFASLPDWNATDGVEAVAAEAEWALKEAGANGVVVMTTYGGDKFPGHPQFKPIWDKLDELRAVMFVHPSEVFISPKFVASMPQPLIDYPLATTRAAADMVLTQTLATHPHVKVILSHAGGALPFLAERIIMLSGLFNLSQEECRRDMRRFYVDTALSTSKAQLTALTSLIPPDHILYGSDWPYVSPIAAERGAHELDNFITGCCHGCGRSHLDKSSSASHDEIDEREKESLAGIWQDNAEKLFGWGKYARK